MIHIFTEVNNYVPKYFKPYELVSRDIYRKFGNRSLEFLDTRLLWTIDNIREKFGKVVVNDWYWGGKFQYRGYRENECTVGAKESQHRHGRALDFHLVDGVKYPPYLFRKLIINNPQWKEFKFITGVEDFQNMNWIHIDVRNWDRKNNGYKIFNG